MSFANCTNKVKVFHIHAGVDLIGSKTSMAATKNILLERGANGIWMYSQGSKRLIEIPEANIKGIEYFVPSNVLEMLEQLGPVESPKRGRPPKTVA